MELRLVERIGELERDVVALAEELREPMAVGMDGEGEYESESEGEEEEERRSSAGLNVLYHEDRDRLGPLQSAHMHSFSLGTEARKSYVI